MAFLPKDQGPKKRGLILALAFALVPLPGCALVRLFKPTPASSVTLGDAPKATSDGNQTAPAEISSQVTTQTLTLPAGSTIALAPAAAAPEAPQKPVLQTTATLSAPAVLSTRTETQTAHTATPPAPPTPLQAAQASTFKYYVIAGLVLFAAAALAFYLQHYLAGIKFALAGVFLPALAHFVAEHVAIIAAAALIAAGITAIVLYYSHVQPARAAAALDKLRTLNAPTP